MPESNASYRFNDSGRTELRVGSFPGVVQPKEKEQSISVYPVSSNVKDSVKLTGSSSVFLDYSDVKESFYKWVGTGKSVTERTLPFSITIRGSNPDGTPAKKLNRALIFLINPSEMTSSTNFSSDSNMTRGGHVVTLNGRNQETISLRGTFPAYYGVEGLTAERYVVEGASTGKNSSAGFLHRMQVLELYKNAGYITFSASESAYGNGVATQNIMDNRSVIYSMDNYSLDYDGVSYTGNFTSFSVDEDASTPYLCKYNMEFIVSSRGKVGFSGHYDNNPSSRRQLVVDQDSITDKYGFSSKGLKPSVAVPEYMKTKFKNLAELDPTAPLAKSKQASELGVTSIDTLTLSSFRVKPIYQFSSEADLRKFPRLMKACVSGNSFIMNTSTKSFPLPKKVYSVTNSYLLEEDGYSWLFTGEVGKYSSLSSAYNVDLSASTTVYPLHSVPSTIKTKGGSDFYFGPLKLSNVTGSILNSLAYVQIGDKLNPVLKLNGSEITTYPNTKYFYYPTGKANKASSLGVVSPGSPELYGSDDKTIQPLFSLLTFF